ncbi:MAG: pantothenate kinase [Myxococcales bacterium]|mgnify:CR=1 FL=1|nr:pantothenate kinase [Myxococcales bacterium]|tara:strand:+ start:7500 stop:8276 length:777 start_codon:yes stop_codon:yes gene_type:complete
MLLAIDVGNTHTVLGVWDDTRLSAHWRVTTRSERTSDEMSVLIQSLFGTSAEISKSDISDAIVSSVVPSLTRTMVDMTKALFDVDCLVVGPGLKTGMPIRYEDPREVGADRIVNAVAAYNRWSSGLVIVDFGTATTFDVVSPDGAYLGGSICPGIGISSQALFAHAARLPRVDFVRPEHVVGRNTVASIQSGLVFGYVGLVEGLIKRIKDSVDFEFSVVATGGLATQIARETSVIKKVESDLTLDGLRILHLRNRNRD